MSTKQPEASARQELGGAVMDVSCPGPQGPGKGCPHNGSKEPPKNGSADLKESRRWR
jgi:hypothetical protein